MVYGVCHISNVLDSFTNFKSVSGKQTERKSKRIDEKECVGSHPEDSYEHNFLFSNLYDLTVEASIYHIKSRNSFQKMGSLTNEPYPTPQNPKQNRVAERMNRTLPNMVRSMLLKQYLPKYFWA